MPTLLREYLLVIRREDAIEEHRVQLVVYEDRPSDDVNRWAFIISGGSLGQNWHSIERKARDRFANEVRRLRILERSLHAEGIDAQGRFLKGSFVADG